jgi:hypothetical protein
VYGGTKVIPIPKFCEDIKAGDAHALSLAPLVLELGLLMWRSTDGFEDLILVQESLGKIINSILSFRNLTKLSMKRCITSSAIMEQLGKLVQLESLHTLDCWHRGESYDAPLNLQSLHTLGCVANSPNFDHPFKLACISMKNLRILKTTNMAVSEALLTTDPPVQLKKLYLTYSYNDDYTLLWNYLARVTSLTHLSLPSLGLSRHPPSCIFPFPELQYLHIDVAFAPRFADQPMKKLKIDTRRLGIPGRALAEEVRQYYNWQGVVFPHVEYLEVDSSRRNEL